MVAASVPIADALREFKADLSKITTNGSQRGTIVCGNQSADMDSMCSAIVFSYLARLRAVDGAFSHEYIPMVNIPPADLAIRPEFTYIFEQLGIDPKTLVTQDDVVTLSSPPQAVDPAPGLPPDQTLWILVDHNNLEGELGQVYGKRVGGVVDHHVDEHVITDTFPEPRRIEVAGSCTSLVIDEFKSVLDQYPKDLPGSAAALAGLAKLALAAILIDTKNLTSKTKTQPVDLEAGRICEELIRASEDNAGWDRQAFFDQLDGAKKSVDSLPLDGILRKDYKEWHEHGVRLGMSAVVKPLSLLGSKAQQEGPWERVAHDYMAARRLDLWAVLTSSDDPASGKGRRELYVQWQGPVAARAVERFVQQASDELRLAPKHIEGLEASQTHVWQQGARHHTRKQVAPLMRRAMADAAGQQADM